MVQTLSHCIAQVVVRPAESGIAAGEKGVLLALQGAAGARTVAPGFADHFGVHGIDLAIEIGKLGIGAAFSTARLAAAQLKLGLLLTAISAPRRSSSCASAL